MDLFHYGTKRHSGRYPYGSGDNPYQRTSQFLARVEELRKNGLSEIEIAKSFNLSKNQFEAKKSAERNAERKANESFALRLKEKGYSNTAIAERMGRNESYVRTLLKPSENQKKDIVNKARESLKEQVDNLGMIDVGKGVELHINGGISSDKFKAALAGLEDEGYVIHTINVPQLSGTDQYTTMKVLAPPGTDPKDIFKNRDSIQTIATRQSNEKLKNYNEILPPVSVNSKRISVVYSEDGGDKKDGLIELRPGSEDLNLGASKYAQVRIAVDGTHYIKGVAVYNDSLPEGVDIRFNTSKKKGTPLISKKDDNEVLKKMKDDPSNPFESTIKRQLEYTDKNGKQKQSALNIVNEEGDWATWNKSLASQFVSKQRPSFAKKQLGLALGLAKDDLDEALRITNPAVKAKVLQSLADRFDSDARHLNAAAVPRQSWRVILPISSLKDNEVYAPDYRNGEKVVLIRYPHAGIFELPELTVNNKNKEAKKVLGSNPYDAIGINSKVASKLSGADFDGDSVIVIPNNNGQVKTSKSLKALKNFDPKEKYPYVEGMKLMTKAGTGKQMGDISNLITDMTIKGAPDTEIARAVRHSMVVIDAYKHKLNYKQSYDDNGIASLKEKYQGGAKRGAATLISRSNSQAHIPHRKLRSMKDGGAIDPKTGKKVWVNTGKKIKDKNGNLTDKLVKVTKMDITDDAFTLSSGTHIENIYAEYSNKLKSMANEARKEILNIKPIKQSKSAKKVYSSEVASLNAKLNLALKNAPLERKAQLVANNKIDILLKDNPHMEKDKLKKTKARELTKARILVGAKKNQIVISNKEWEAIQSGAISHTKLVAILANSDLDTLKKLAMPKTSYGLTANKEARAKAMINQGYTRAEVADALGVSTSTIAKVIEKG